MLISTLDPPLNSEQMEIKSLNDVASLIIKFGNDKFEAGRDPYLTIEGSIGLTSLVDRTFCCPWI